MYYDFNAPTDVAAELHHSFDMVVVDPPFITRDVWEKYAETTRLLLKEDPLTGATEGARVLVSTVAENHEMMKELLGVEPVAFKPSIPHLVYQYDCYTNYKSDRLSVPNPEIPE